MLLKIKRGTSFNSRLSCLKRGYYVKGLRFAIFFMLFLVFNVFFVTALSSNGFNNDFSVTGGIINNEILPNQTAVFIVNITNKADSAERFRFEFPNDFLFTVETNPLRFSGVEIESNSTASTKIFIRPKNVKPGWYIYRVIIRAENSKNAKQINFPVFVKEPGPFTPPTYKPKVIIKNVRMTNNGVIDPRNKFMIEFTFKNKNLLNIRSMRVKLISPQLGSFVKILPLEPLGVDTVSFDLDYDDNTLPKKENLTLYWSVENVTFGPELIPVEIAGYELPFSTLTIINQSFLVKNITVYFTNKGTLPRVESFKLKVPFLGDSFTLISPPYEKIVEVNGKKYYLWNIELNPGMSEKITVYTDYRTLFIVIFFIISVLIIALFTYFYFRPGVVVNKKAIVQRIEEGGIGEYKIVIYIKNRTSKPVNSIKIVDILPKIAKLSDSFEVGTLKPKKILHHKTRGTLLRWEISTLEPGEERIISYRTSLRLAVVGKLVLPAVKVRYLQGHRLRTSSSQKIVLSRVGLL